MDETWLSVLLDAALLEDLGTGDLTTEALFTKAVAGQAALVAKQELVVCGQMIAHKLCKRFDSNLSYREITADGQLVEPGTVIGKLDGSVAGILSLERTLLNFLQHLSGVATLTRQFVGEVEGTGAKVLDTRKTLPGYRELEKYAVRVGGGTNHRSGLYDAMMLKDNHLDAVSIDLEAAVERLKAYRKHDESITVEVRDQAELERAIRSAPERILLDNMSVEELTHAVTIVRRQAPQIELEASGGVTLQTVRSIAETGVDAISVGALTHSAPAADISLRYQTGG